MALSNDINTLCKIRDRLNASKETGQKVRVVVIDPYGEKHKFVYIRIKNGKLECQLEGGVVIDSVCPEAADLLKVEMDDDQVVFDWSRSIQNNFKLVRVY